MTTMSLRDYATTHHATRQAAHKWQCRNVIVLIAGLVDVEASDARMKDHGLGRYRTSNYGGRRVAGIRSEIARLAPTTDSPTASDARTVELEQRCATLNAEAARYADDYAALGREQHREHVGWYRWPATIAETIAKELRLTKRAADIEAAIQRAVVARLAMLGVQEIDMKVGSTDAL